MMKPPAQKGEAPKIQWTLRITPSLKEAVKSLNGSQIDHVETALREYLTRRGATP